MIIRDAIAADLPGVQAIMNYYRLYTSHIWDRNPLTAGEMEVWLTSHAKHPYAALVAETEGSIAGYASLSRLRPYAGYSPVAENSIYLAPDRLRTGTGTSLMNALLQRAAENGLRVVTAWIDSKNAPSVKFHEKFGFYYVGILKNVGILDDTPTSVIIMQHDIY